METNYNSWRVFGGGFWTFFKVLYFEDVSANERERTLDMIHFTGDIYENIEPQLLL